MILTHISKSMSIKIKATMHIVLTKLDNRLRTDRVKSGFELSNLSAVDGPHKSQWR